MSEAQPRYIEGRTVSLACFEVQAQVYALDVLSVCEIVRMQPITPLPNSPRLIEGVIDLCGAVIPVLDLARVLGLGSVTPSLHARIVVLEWDDLVFGLRVDAATDVLSLAADRLEDVPQLATHAGCDAVRYVVRRAGARPVMVLALEPLIEKVVGSERPAELHPGGGR